jgi:hypothetical protein
MAQQGLSQILRQTLLSWHLIIIANKRQRLTQAEREPVRPCESLHIAILISSPSFLWRWRSGRR